MKSKLITGRHCVDCCSIKIFSQCQIARDSSRAPNTKGRAGAARHARQSTNGLVVVVMVKERGEGREGEGEGGGGADGYLHIERPT